jgi:hypothetical protein
MSAQGLGRRLGRGAARVLSGSGEPIFDVLPESVISNLLRPASENAVLWNLIYRLAQPALSLKSLAGAPRLWGTPMAVEEPEDRLLPYFWGYAVGGERLEGLDEALDEVDGPGPQTEVDLFLVGRRDLIAVEAKHLGRVGRCSRYAADRCPEVHREEAQVGEPCRYWEGPGPAFADALDFGRRPAPGDVAPPCDRHYQLGRSLLVVRELGRRLDLRPGLWLLLPRRRWPALEPLWLDFVERVRDDALWRRSRVVAWEDLASLARSD